MTCIIINKSRVVFMNFNFPAVFRFIIINTMIKIFYKSYDNLIYIKRNTMHKRKSIRILYVVHLFKCRGRKYTE